MRRPFTPSTLTTSLALPLAACSDADNDVVDANVLASNGSGVLFVRWIAR